MKLPQHPVCRLPAKNETYDMRQFHFVLAGKNSMEFEIVFRVNWDTSDRLGPHYQFHRRLGTQFCQRGHVTRNRLGDRFQHDFRGNLLIAQRNARHLGEFQFHIFPRDFSGFHRNGVNSRG